MEGMMYMVYVSKVGFVLVLLRDHVTCLPFTSDLFCRHRATSSCEWFFLASFRLISTALGESCGCLAPVNLYWMKLVWLFGTCSRATKLQVTYCGSQLDKPRLFLAATDTVLVNMFGIDNCKCVIHMCVFMYYVGNKVITTTCRTKIKGTKVYFAYLYNFSPIFGTRNVVYVAWI